MSETEVGMIMTAIGKLETSVNDLREKFTGFCTNSAEKFTRLDDRIGVLERERASGVELGKWKKEWSLKKWIFGISFITIVGVVLTGINIILGWTK